MLNVCPSYLPIFLAALSAVADPAPYSPLPCRKCHHHHRHARHSSAKGSSVVFPVPASRILMKEGQLRKRPLLTPCHDHHPCPHPIRLPFIGKKNTNIKESIEKMSFWTGSPGTFRLGPFSALPQPVQVSCLIRIRMTLIQR